MGHLEVESNYAILQGMFWIFCNCLGFIYPKLNQKMFLKINSKTVYHEIMAKNFFVLCFIKIQEELVQTIYPIITSSKPAVNNQ